ncbi:helix-turn-helix domain-containing protein [Halotalea alkalilenta]|uniref:helix-turn-helix domain-containing protein n=1 Tax=Halotalea alkalilenta TaxID=376489 RepID=UPI003F8C1050
MAEENSLGRAIKAIRKVRGLSQEAFSEVSSRTYLSSLERGVKNPTLPKLNELCQVMQVHSADPANAFLCAERCRRFRPVSGAGDKRAVSYREQETATGMK